MTNIFCHCRKYFATYQNYLINIFRDLPILFDKYFSYFGFSDAYISESNGCRQRLITFVNKTFFDPKEPASTAGKEEAPTANQSKQLDPYLNLQDDFKTNLMWLSIFVRSVEGVGMRLPVNYRTVLQTNYFDKEGKEAKNIHDAVYEPDGDTFQNSPIKLVFFAGFHKGTNNDQPGILHLTSNSKVNVNASECNLSQNMEYSDMTLLQEGIHCLWPRQEDLAQFLYLLGYHPVKSLGVGNHDFPWNEILGLFNDIDMKAPDVLEYMLRHLSLGFLYEKSQDLQQNLTTFKNFVQFMSPIFTSAVEGNHRLELANRLLYGIALEEKAPFFKGKPRSSAFQVLPFNSTVHKPIQAVVYLQAQKGSDLCKTVTTHLIEISRKTAKQKTLYIRDNWRSLYQSILTALENDTVFERYQFKTQKEFYEISVDKRQKQECRARKNRQRLSEIIADVIFAENPTAGLAALAARNSKTNKNPPTIGSWKKGFGSAAWTLMDNNPFPGVRSIRVFVSSPVLFTKFIFLIFFVIPSLLF